MSDKFKQFKNELIDLCEKYGYGILATHNSISEEVVMSVYGPSFLYAGDICSGDQEAYVDKNTPKEDI